MELTEHEAIDFEPLQSVGLPRGPVSHFIKSNGRCFNSLISGKPRLRFAASRSTRSAVRSSCRMSTIGLQGGTARCYDWWMDYLKCMDESKQPMLGLRKRECVDWLEDYHECLHHGKERIREHLVERERRKAAEGPKGPASH